jgi:hypothetical protein
MNVDYYEKCLAVLLKTCGHGDRPYFNFNFVYKCSVQKQHPSHELLMMETETVFETPETNPTLIPLILGEDFTVKITKYLFSPN